jgi:radical SAM protein with 4Fe4S-binding SPASM domain
MNAPMPLTDSTRLPALPRFAQLEPVGQCNLRCQMCAIQFREDGPPHGPLAFMDFDTFTRLIDGFDGLEQLHLQGLGEPTMNPRFFDMVSYAVERGIRVTANSNLTLLNGQRAHRCVDCGLDSLFVSIDGVTAETYERIRVRSQLSRVIANLQTLIEARTIAGSLLPHLHLVMVIMRQNLHELPDLVRFAADWQFESMFVQHLANDFEEPSLPEKYRPMHEFVAEQTLLGEDRGRIERSFNAARAVAAERGIELRLPRTETSKYPPRTPGRERCSWPWDQAYVSYDGRAMPCCMVGTPDRATLGNMAADGVLPVWENAAYQDFRARLASEVPPEVCQSCALYQGTF